MRTLAPTHEATGVVGSTLQRWMRRVALQRLQKLERGALHIHDPIGSTRIGTSACAEVRADVYVHDLDFYRRIVFGGGLGAAEAYLDGQWDTSNLVELFRLFVRNPELNTGVEAGLARLLAPLNKLGHWLRRNTRAGSRVNISEHYDLSNDLFQLFLDRETLSYSSGIYPTPAASLDEAAVHKLDEVCRKLELGHDDHLLEIGTGFGGLTIHAARETGCRVTTTTISQQQYSLATQRIQQAGLADRVEVLLVDYRDLEGQYDKLVSVEMIEAVGAEYYQEYFARCSALLKPDGLMLVQAITISDRLFHQSRYEVDYIKKYIFPGCCIPSMGAMTEAVARATDLDTVDVEDIGPHYARTLRDWRLRFLGERARVLALGFDERFIRMWEYYLTYCEAGFEERQLRDLQIVLAKPFNRRTPLQWDGEAARAARCTEATC